MLFRSEAARLPEPLCDKRQEVKCAAKQKRDTVDQDSVGLDNANAHINANVRPGDDANAN